MPKILNSIGVWGAACLVLSVFVFMIWVKNQKLILSLSLTSMVLILIGYSTYAPIFIRSNQDPGIDENDPETIEAFISYLEREQYGDVGILPRRFNGIPPIHEVCRLLQKAKIVSFHHLKRPNIENMNRGNS